MKEKLLFVGASGAVAEKALPALAEHYDLVGITRTNQALAPYCVELLSGDLTSEASRLFEEVFARHAFSSIVWNVVRYHPSSLMGSTRGAMHVEFDLGIALPLECLKCAVSHGLSEGTFVLVTSGLAFGISPPWGSYSIIKRGQVVLAEYLAAELRDQGIAAKTIALGAVAQVPFSTIGEVFTRAAANTDPEKLLYRAYGKEWD